MRYSFTNRLIFKTACGVGLMALLIAFSGCGLRGTTPPAWRMPHMVKPVPKRVPSPVRLTDITAQAGIHFKHNSGAFGLKLYPESMGSGAAFIDYDGDGYPDIFFVNGRDWTQAEVRAYTDGPGRVAHDEHGFILPTQPPHRHTTGALYHNNRDGTFTDVTRGSGLDVEMQGLGVAIGDYDNDGRPDLYVTALGRNYLFHNEGGGKFRELARVAGVEDSGFSTSAMWVDYDRDSKLDLFVCRYIEWSPATDIWNDGSVTDVSGIYRKTYAGPFNYDGQASHLYRNVGGGRFVDVSARTGILGPMAALTAADLTARAAARRSAALAAHETMRQWMERDKAPTMHAGKSMGVALCDVNGDGWPDILVANDGVRNYLYVNNKNGTFTERGVPSGVSYGPHGQVRAGMGVDVGDVDHSDRDCVVIGNFDHEALGFYQNQGGGAFAEVAGDSGVAGPSLPFLTFGCLFLDVDNDGWLDILTANGHVQDIIHEMRRDLDYAERPLLYLNRGQGQPVKFDEVGRQSGAAMSVPRVARGVACADIDLDGDVDVLFTTKGENIEGSAPVLLRNDPTLQAERNNALRVTLEGTKSNRSAIGALVEAHLPKQPGQITGEVVRRMVKSGSSYLSQSELPVTLGLGRQTRVATLTVRWPSGALTELRDISANQAITINEDRGIVRRRKLVRHK